MLYQEKLTVTLSDGRKLGYAEYGDSKGKPLFYFHGWPSARLRASITGKQAKELGIRLISLDRPGIGLSTYKENRKLLDYPDDVIELADTLKIKNFAVVGVSGGGPYAAAMAYKYPERLTKVGIVVGLAPTWIPENLKGMAPLGALGWANYSKYPITAYFAAWYWDMLYKYMPFLSIFSFVNKSDTKVAKGLLKKDDFLNKEAFRQGIRGALKELFLYTSDWGFNVQDITARVYLFYGETDRAVPIAMAKYYAAHIKGSILTTYPNEGHLCQITHGREIMKTLTNQ